MRAALSLSLLLVACGARTDLEVAASEESMDAGFDAGRDAGPDGGLDAGRDGGCRTGALSFTRDPAEIVFVLDRSGSMFLTWNGLPFGNGQPSRWMIVEQALTEVLPPFDRAVAFGANVYPDGRDDESCRVSESIDVPPRLEGVPNVLRVFVDESPVGGTPTADGVRTTLEALLADGADRPRFLVVTTDGGPNCNGALDGETCVCTGPRTACLDPDRGAESCLDDERTVETIREAYEEHGIPVLVIGIDGGRAELADALDRMAIAGGWPRPEGSERRFYDAREPDDLRAAFSEIVERIAECVVTADRAAPEGEVEIAMDGVVIERDPDHLEGWDWTDPEAGILAFFGSACARLRETGGTVTGRILTCGP